MYSNFKSFVCYFIIITSLALSTACKADEEAVGKTQKFIITPFAGYRYDVFRWSIPEANSTNSKKNSELTWKNHISETGIKIEMQPEGNQFSFQGQLKYGYILPKSRNQDSDWDNIGEFSKAFSSVKGNTFDLSGAIGFSQNITPVLVTYCMGIDYSKCRMQSYGVHYSINRLRNQNISNIDKLGRIYPKSQLVTRYNFSNYSPWLGASMNYSFNDKFSIIPTVKLYLFFLYGQANWVLRDDFQHNPSFVHKALGIGASFDNELLYKHSNNLDLRVNLGIKKLSMTKGKDKAFLANNTTLSKDLKKLSLFSSFISGGIRYHF